MAKAKKEKFETTGETTIFKEIDKLNTQFGSGTIVMLGEDAEIQDIPKISTGSIGLDKALGGGIPKKRMIEIFGDPGAGKTTLALHIVAEFQKAGETVAYIDAENSLDTNYAKSIGVDVTKMPVAQVDCGEDAFTITESLMDSNKIGLIVFDSIAALAPRSEIEGDFGDANMGAHARMMSQGLRKLNKKMAKKDITLLFINQKRNKIVMFGNPVTTTGGLALKFYASVRLDVSTVGKPIEVDDIPIASETMVKVAKNKVAPPFRKASFIIAFGKGIDKEREIIDFAVKLGIVEKSGSWYSYKGERIGQGIENASKEIIEMGIFEDIATDVRQKISEEEVE
jgi:recombination protein RecA